MTEYKCGSAESCKYGDMCKPNFNIGACSHYKAEEPQTNEDWFCLLPTEEKAKVLANAAYSSACLATEILFFGKEAEQKKWERWLKEKHNEMY